MEPAESNSIPSTEADRRYYDFQLALAEVAERQQLYLREEGKRIEDCYTLELRSGNARLEVGRELPFDLYEDIHACWKQSFS